MKAQIAAAIQAVVRLQLDDCKRAIKNGTKTIALNELEDAIRQLKLLAKRLEALGSVTAREPFHHLLHGCVRSALNITGGQSTLQTCVAESVAFGAAASLHMIELRPLVRYPSAPVR